jgi:serine/threonine protein phosphatase PrpC
MYGVFDGHAGKGSAQTAQKCLLPMIKANLQDEQRPPIQAVARAFLQCDEAMPPDGSGCTACVAVVERLTGRLWVANAGDSRCVLARDGKAVPLSLDHKPGYAFEQYRLDTQGGSYKLYPGNVWRVVYWKPDCHMALSVCRALGDNHYNDHGDIISAKPQVAQEQLTPADRFLVIACDGLWDVLTNQEVVDFVAVRLAQGLTYPKIAAELAQHAIAVKRSEDNVTVLVIGLN